MARLEQPITFRQGSTFQLKINATMPAAIPNDPPVNFDITGWTPRSQIRQTVDAPAILAQFTFTAFPAASPPYWIGELTATETSLVPHTGEAGTQSYRYDVEIENNVGTVANIQGGPVGVLPEVTR